MVFEVFGPLVGALGKALQLGFVLFVRRHRQRPVVRGLLVVCGLLYLLAAVSNHFACCNRKAN